MNFGSLFSGIGGLDLGLERAGMTCKWQVEIDDFCQKVLDKHWPEVRKYRDVREVGKHNLEPVDLIAGGFPCQDVSLAGKRAGLGGKRSTLWTEYARIISEIKPRWVLAENVLGLFSSDNGEFFGKILFDLAKIGYDAEWEVIPASFVGAIHRRERVWILAYPQGFGLEKATLQNSQHKKGSVEKPKQWESLFSISAGAYQINEQWKNYQADICGDDDGLSSWVDRLKSLGNAVVPQVAEYIGRCILESEQEVK